MPSAGPQLWCLNATSPARLNESMTAKEIPRQHVSIVLPVLLCIPRDSILYLGMPCTLLLMLPSTSEADTGEGGGGGGGGARVPGHPPSSRS